MSDFIILTDSSADLSGEMAQAADVQVLPLTFTIGGADYHNYPDNREMDPHLFYEKLRAGEGATTAAVNVAEYVDAVEPLLQAGHDVLILAFSSGLSTTYNSSAIAVEELHHLGAESLIKIAACPAIQPELEPGTLLAASGAVRGEGATREYIDPSYPAVADMPLLGALLSCGVPDAGLFRSHDCTSLETPWAPGGPARIARWAELGVSALDGETSALFVLASILGMHAASLAYLAENYATGAAAPMDAQARGRLFTAAAEALRCC